MRYANGSSWLGGFAGAVAGLTLFTLLARLPLFRVYDLLVPCAALGQAFGRLGCFLAGDGCYGRYTELPWGMAFPHGTVPIAVTVHPTPLYDAAALFALSGVLIWLIRSRRPAGTATVCYLFATGALRFFMEFIRLTPVVRYGLTEAQLVCLFWIAVAVTFTLALAVIHSSRPRTGGRFRQALIGNPT